MKSLDEQLAEANKTLKSFTDLGVDPAALSAALADAKLLPGVRQELADAKSALTKAEGERDAAKGEVVTANKAKEKAETDLGLANTAKDTAETESTTAKGQLKKLMENVKKLASHKAAEILQSIGAGAAAPGETSAEVGKKTEDAMTARQKMRAKTQAQVNKANGIDDEAE